MVYLLIILTLLIAPLQSNGNDRGLSTEQRNLVSEQLERYILHYDDAKSPSAWLIYQYIEDNRDHIPLIEELAYKHQETSSFYNIIDCIESDMQNYALNFVKCADDPSLVLSFMHKNSLHDTLLSILSSHYLNEREKFHLSYLSGDTVDANYPITEKPHFLDIYYFDKIVEDDNINNELFEKWVTNILNKSPDDFYYPDRITSFITTVFALYNINKESDIIEISGSLNQIEQTPIIPKMLRTLRFISFSAYSNGYYQFDISFNRNFIIPVTTYFSKEEEAIARLDFGVSLYQLGNIHASLEELEVAYQYLEYVDDRFKSAILNNLGIVYYYTGLFEDYIQLILEALDYAKITNSEDLVIRYLNNLHVYYKKLENWNIAYEYLNQIYNKSKMYDNKTNTIIAYRSFATYYRDYKDDFEKSVYFLDKAYNLSSKSENHQLPFTILSEIVATYIHYNKYEDAIFYTDKLYQKALYFDYERYLLYSHVNYANIKYAREDYKSMTAHIDSMITYDKQTLNMAGRAQYTIALSRGNIVRKEPSEAFNSLEIFADKIISRVRHSSELQSGHLILVDEFRNLFEYLIKKLIEHNKYDKALYWMEEVKNLSSASFYNNPALKSTILDENELVLDFALRNRIERLRSELRTADEDQRVQLNNSLLEAISQQNALRRKVLQNIDLEPANLERIRRNLGSSDVILYFSKFNNYLFATAISSGTFEMTKLSFSQDDIARIDTLVHSLSSDKVKLSELAWLREKVIGKMNIPDRFTNYYVVPDGFLYHIPFEIFPEGEIAGDYSYGEATYLIEHASISYINSLKDLERSFAHTPRRNHDYDFLGFGISHFNESQSQLMPGRVLPPLPLAEREVTDIASLLDQLSRNIYHLSEDGTERNFRERAGKSRILHLASHSEVFENDPLYSLIYLNPDIHTDNSNPGSSQISEDGLIYAYELFDMDLSNEMIMLNSCESGSGNYIQGSGIVGFSRAFNYAGVQSLVMNLWTIRDRPAYDMSVSFYSYLNEGYSKSEAMQKAKVDYINHVNSNPSSWGSFVIYGNVDPIIPSNRPWIIASAILLFGILSLVLAWLRVPVRIKSYFLS